MKILPVFKIAVLAMSASIMGDAFAAIDLNGNPLEIRHGEIQIEIGSVKKDIEKKTKIYHALKSGASSPLFAWETEAVIEKKRKSLLPYLKIEIKEKLKLLEFLESQLDEVQYDLDLQKITPETNLSVADKISLSKNPSHFSCQVAPSEPLSGQMQLMQGFGSHTDKESGLKWNSSGWWISHITGPIKVCAKGIVVFDGRIQGRGRVVMIDHGQGMLSLYANLSEENSGEQRSYRVFSKGDKIEAGSVLGSAKEKFYFEIRKNGEALDPKFALKSDHLEKFKF